MLSWGARVRGEVRTVSWTLPGLPQATFEVVKYRRVVPRSSPDFEFFWEESGVGKLGLLSQHGPPASFRLPVHPAWKQPSLPACFEMVREAEASVWPPWMPLNSLTMPCSWLEPTVCGNRPCGRQAVHLFRMCMHQYELTGGIWSHPRPWLQDRFRFTMAPISVTTCLQEKNPHFWIPKHSTWICFLIKF